MESLQLSQVLADLSNLGAAVGVCHLDAFNAPCLNVVAVGTRGCRRHRQRQCPHCQGRTISRTEDFCTEPSTAAPDQHEAIVVIRGWCPPQV